MNKEIAHILKGKIKDLPFIDVIAGMAQTVTRDQPQDEGAAMIQQRFPVSSDTSLPNGCEGGPEFLLIPDSSRKSIIYFEDFGIQSTGREHGLPTFNSSIRLIAWLNRAKLTGDHYAEISGRAMAMIINLLAGRNPENVDMFTRLSVSVARIPPQEPALFGRYTYDETLRQYLRPPFEFFGIDFTCRYAANISCLNQIQWNNESCL